MPVYVDDMRAPFGRLIMCHMRADTHAELVAMADAIGVARKWIQFPGTWKEHYDICLSKRAKAVTLGAIEITQRQMGMMRREQRVAAVLQQMNNGQAAATLPRQLSDPPAGANQTGNLFGDD